MCCYSFGSPPAPSASSLPVGIKVDFKSLSLLGMKKLVLGSALGPVFLHGPVEGGCPRSCGLEQQCEHPSMALVCSYLDSLPTEPATSPAAKTGNLPGTLSCCFEQL